MHEEEIWLLVFIGVFLFFPNGHGLITKYWKSSQMYVYQCCRNIKVIIMDIRENN